MIFRTIIIFVLAIGSYSCSKKEEVIYEPKKKVDAFELYKEGMKAFDKNDFFC